MRCGCVCLGLVFGCVPPLLAGGLGCVCVCVRAPLVPRNSWLGCAVWVCVLRLGFRLRPGTPGWGVGLCVCLCACPACTPPPLTRVCGVGVCAWTQVLPRPATPACGVRVCVCLFARSACTCHSWLGGAVCMCVLLLGFWRQPATPGWGAGCCVSVCSVCLYPTFPGWGLWCVGWVLPGTCSCAVARCGLCALPGFAAPGGRCCLAPVCVPWLGLAACLSGVPRGPSFARRASSGPVAPGAPVGFSDAVVPFPARQLAAPDLLGGCAGHVEADR